MDELIAYWPLALIAAAVALLLLYLLIRPRQRVKLTDTTPVRPHMTSDTKPTVKHKGLADEAIAVAADVGEGILAARPDAPRAGSAGEPDDLVLLKGIGPKLAALLNGHGLTRFDQIASLSPPQVADIDSTLGAFRGRLTRDDVVAQADYLARGDVDGFEQRFGKL